MSAAGPVVLEPRAAHRASIIWLHGLGASGSDFVPLAEALALPAAWGVRHIFPHAPARAVTVNMGMHMPAWYDILGLEITSAEDRAGLDESADYVQGLLDAEQGVRVVLAGFSQGGALTLHAGLRHRRALAGLLVMSAYLPLPQLLAEQAATVNREVPVLMLHGTEDAVVPCLFGWRSYERLKADGYAVEWRDYPIEHTVSPQQISDVRGWLERVLPEPAA